MLKRLVELANTHHIILMPYCRYDELPLDPYTAAQTNAEYKSSRVAWPEFKTRRDASHYQYDLRSSYGDPHVAAIGQRQEDVYDTPADLLDQAQCLISGPGDRQEANKQVF